MSYLYLKIVFSLSNKQCNILRKDKYIHNVRRVRNFFYLYRNRKINLCLVFKTQTKISLAIGFFILTKRHI